MRTPDAAMRTSAARLHQLWQVFQRWRLQSPEGPLHQGSATPRCLEHQVFQNQPLPCHKHVGATAVAHLRVATIFVAAHLTRTFPERTYRQPLQQPIQDLLRIRDVRVGARGGSADAARTSTEGAAPTTPPGEVIDRMRQLEHSRVSRAALRAGPTTVARKFGPAGPEHESSWAVLPEDVPEDEPDVLY
jgi:hypothetical protein